MDSQSKSVEGVDLENGVLIEVGGECGKYNTLPIDMLILVSQNLQRLITELVKIYIHEDVLTEIKNFNIELSGYYKNSAVPEFIFTKRVVPTAGTNVLLQRKEISDHFNEVLKVADGGNYLQLQQLYTDPLQLAPIAGALYEFTHSCGTAPISIVHWENGALSETYKLSKFTKEARNQLMVITPKVEEEKEERIVPGLVRITKKGSALPKLKAMEEFSDKEVTLSFAPNIICHEYNTYQLRIPLQCGLTKVDDFYVIKNDLLDIIGVGETVTEAEINFSEEFDFTYQRYNELQDIELTERIKAIRNFLNYFVISINKQNGGA